MGENITVQWTPPEGALNYTYNVVFFTTKGKGGNLIGRRLATYAFEPVCAGAGE